MMMKKLVSAHSFRDSSSQNINEPKSYGTRNAFDEKGHNTKDCYFPMKIRKTLGYIIVEPRTITQICHIFQGKYTSQQIEALHVLFKIQILYHMI